MRCERCWIRRADSCRIWAISCLASSPPLWWSCFDIPHFPLQVKTRKGQKMSRVLRCLEVMLAKQFQLSIASSDSFVTVCNKFAGFCEPNSQVFPAAWLKKRTLYSKPLADHAAHPIFFALHIGLRFSFEMMVLYSTCMQDTNPLNENAYHDPDTAGLGFSRPTFAILC